MRISIQGRTDAERFWAEMKRLTDWLESHGVQEMRGLNIYFNPTNEHGDEVTITNADGNELTGYVIKPPSKKVASKRKSGNVIQLNPEKPPKEISA